MYCLLNGVFKLVFELILILGVVLELVIGLRLENVLTDCRVYFVNVESFLHSGVED